MCLTDETLAASISATSPMFDVQTVLDADGFGVFINPAPARAPQAPPGCACTHALPFLIFSIILQEP
jgi:hypothetical protein